MSGAMTKDEKPFRLVEWFQQDLPILCGLLPDPKTHAKQIEKPVPRPIEGWEVAKVRGDEAVGSKADVGLILDYEMHGGYSTAFHTVVDFVDGSPAARCAKFKIRDRLLDVDGTAMCGRSVMEVAQKLEGREGSAVSVTMQDVETLQQYTVRLTRRFPFLAIRPAPKQIIARPSHISAAELERACEGRDPEKFGLNPQQIAQESRAGLTQSAAQYSAALSVRPNGISVLQNHDEPPIMSTFKFQ